MPKSPKPADNITIIDVNQQNVDELGLFCVKNKKAPGYKAKADWFKAKQNAGIKIKIALNAQQQQIGFIEYLPAEQAWRPIKAENYYFVQCLAMFAKDAREKGCGSILLQQCELEAKENRKSGVCAMSSQGPWMANASIFQRNEYLVADTLDRFELMVKSFSPSLPGPTFIDWNQSLKKYQGWHLVYADQCPWHMKSVTDLHKSAQQHGIDLVITRLKTPKEAQQAPSGFATFSLIKDGELLADHYISKTRFENILKQQLK